MTDVDVVVEAPILLFLPLSSTVIVTAPIELSIPSLVTVIASMTLSIPSIVTVIAPISLNYKLPVSGCTDDDDCPFGYVCENGVCVPENGNNGGNGDEDEDWKENLEAWLEKNWMWLGAGGLGAAGLILAWPKGKK